MQAGTSSADDPQAIVAHTRAVPGGLDPSIKSSNLWNNLLALRAAHERGAYEALMIK